MGLTHGIRQVESIVPLVRAFLRLSPFPAWWPGLKLACPAQYKNYATRKTLASKDGLVIFHKPNCEKIGPRLVRSRD